VHKFVLVDVCKRNFAVLATKRIMQQFEQ